MARNKLSRKALKEDVIQDVLFDLIDWAHRRQTWLISIAAAVLVTAAAGYGIFWYQDSRERQQASSFFEIESALQSDQSASAGQAEPGQEDAKNAENAENANGSRAEQAIAGYRKFIAQFPDGGLTPVAWLHLGRLFWEQAELKEALAAYRSALLHEKSSLSQQDMARLGLARLAEREGNLEVSAEYFRALSDQPYAELKAFHLGRIAQARKFSEEARTQFEKASHGEPGSVLAEWARQNLDYQP